MNSEQLRSAFKYIEEVISQNDFHKNQLDYIKATLIVNFGPSGKVTQLLTQYQIDTKTVHWLMFTCLEYMYNEVSKLQKEKNQLYNQTITTPEEREPEELTVEHQTCPPIPQFNKHFEATGEKLPKSQNETK